MALKTSSNEVWTTMIDDRAGGAADVLERLASAKVNLEMVFARRTPEQPGRGLMIVGPIKGKKAEQAASAAGLSKSTAMYGVKVEGGDKPGLGAKITRALGNAGISFRGLTAHAIGTKFVCNIALDSADDAARAAAVLKKL
jgi:hypothetical protein